MKRNSFLSFLKSTMDRHEKPTTPIYIGLNMKGVADLAVEGGESVQNLHVTLLYGFLDADFPKFHDNDDATVRIQSAIEAIREDIPDTLHFDRIGRFKASESSDGKDVIYAQVEQGQLEELHKRLLQELKKNGIEVKKTFTTYKPHMTLKYVDPDEEHPLTEIDHTGTIKSITYGIGQDGVGEGEEHRTVAKAFDIFKSDDDKRLVFGWANISRTKDGKTVLDLQGDTIEPEDLEEAAYEYVLNFRDTGEEHISTLRKKGKLVESIVFTKEKMQAMKIPEGMLPEGWWVGFYIEDDDTWEKVKNGTYQMFSIEGKGQRIPLEKSDKINGCGVIVIREDGKILTGTRCDGGKHANQICGPGGHVESGETPEEAAIRETQEEFGITPTDLTQIEIQDGGRAYGKSAIFICTEYDGEPQTDEEEMTDLKWRSITELQDEKVYAPFLQSLELVEDALYEVEAEEEKEVAKTFDEILKFNPFHDAQGRFANKNGFATYSANPKTKAGAMAITRSMQGGHGRTMNVHPESKGESITQNARWLATGQKPKVPAAVSRARYQQRKQQQQQQQQQQQAAKPKQTKPPVNVDSKGFKDRDDADFHDLYNGRGYYQQQQLSKTAKQAADRYLNPNTEAGSLYNFSQNMNHAIKNGTINQQPRYKAVYDELIRNMHNLGHNVNLTRYDHGGALDDMLAHAGKTGGHRNMSVSQIKKALVGQTYGDKRILSTSYNDFKNANNHHTFTTREVKITYRAKASTQVLMPGDGPGGKFGEMLLAPTGANGKNNKYKIVDVKLTGKKARPKGTPMSNLTLKQIEVVVEVE